MIARIYYNVNRSWSGQITLAELRHSNLLATIRLLEEEEDINQITDFFSYEHFYVIYCKFWELDKDHDLFIDKKDLARHNDHGIHWDPYFLAVISYLFLFLFLIYCSSVLQDDRSDILWGRHPRRASQQPTGDDQVRQQHQHQQHEQSAADELHGVCLVPHLRRGQKAPHCHRILVQVGKSLSTPKWFITTRLHRQVHGFGWRRLPVNVRTRILLRGATAADGVIRHRNSALWGLFVSGWLLFFHHFTQSIAFQRIWIIQMLDMIHPSVAGKVSLNDLKRCQMTPIFFDTFFNLEKYLDHEQRDPFASQRDPDSENGDEILKVHHHPLIVCHFNSRNGFSFLFLSRYPTGIVTPPKSTNCLWPKKADRITATTCEFSLFVFRESSAGKEVELMWHFIKYNCVALWAMDFLGSTIQPCERERVEYFASVGERGVSHWHVLLVCAWASVCH